MIKKILPGKKMTIFQLILVLEFVMFHVNRRPIGVTTTLEHIRPADILPVWSQSDPATTMKECTKVVTAAKQEFLDKWNVLYKLSILKQGKWFSSNHNLAIGDIVLITDLMTKLGYPRLGRIAKVEKDTMGTERYYHVSYKKNKGFATIKRTAQSLCMIMKRDEQEDQIIDPILFLDEVDLAPASKKQKVIVKFMAAESEITNN